MKKLKSNDDTLDRLSELPDSLVHQILSLLEMRDVVATTLLSKRWKYRWITIPCLQFVECYNDPVQIRNFVNRALALWRGTHLRKFSVFFNGDYSVFKASFSSDINLWLLFAKQRKVEELSIQLHLRDPLYCPPQCLYECSSIRKLSLVGCNLEIRGNVQWDCLNSLELSLCLFSEDVINQVLSSSPQLETFTLNCLKGFRNLSIRSSSLKKLSIFSYVYESSNLMTIWAPNLEALKISGYPYTNCLLTDVSSLTEVHLCFLGLWPTQVREALCQILPAIQHVVTVVLSDNCFQMLGVMKENYSFPPLLNVKLLRICSGLAELHELVCLLQVFPKLKMLSIDWKSVGEQFKVNAENYIMSEANILKSNLLQLRTAEITWYSYEASMFQFIEFLLKHATVIEKIVIQKGGNGVVKSDVVLAARKVVSLQRSFPSVELIFC